MWRIFRRIHCSGGLCRGGVSNTSLIYTSNQGLDVKLKIMPKKKRPSLLRILFQVLGTSIIWIIAVLIPAGIQIYQFFGGDVNLLNQLPVWVWFSPLFIYAIYVIGKTAYEYRKELNEYKLSGQKPRSQKTKSNKADKNSIALQDASITDSFNTSLTQNFFPQNNPQKVSFPTVSGNIEFRHENPRLDHQRNETECKIVIINNSGQNSSKCAAYIAEVAYKSKKDKQWLSLPDVPSGQPLRWESRFTGLHGFISIDNGHQETLSLFEVKTKRYSKEGSTYSYFLTFYRSTIQLLQETATSHRILIRFHGVQLFGGGDIQKKVYVYLDEDKPGFKKYAGIEEFKGDE